MDNNLQSMGNTGMRESDKQEIVALIKQAWAEEQDDMRELVKVATEETIVETFKVMGIDVTDFDHLNDFRENQNWVKRYRRVSEKVGSRIIVTITTIMTTGFLAAIWAYVQSNTK